MTKQPVFVLGRHGRTAGNDDDVYRGLSNEEFAQLDENGRSDARELGIYLQGTGLQFPVIITDDLDRTNETAQIVADILGIKEIIKDKRLRPVDVGDYTGKSKKKHPLTEYMQDTSKKIPGGTSIKSFNLTQSKVFADIAEVVSKIKKPVLVIGHGSNASYLYHAINKGGKEVGYEGLTEPGGASFVTGTGIVPVFKSRSETKSTHKKKTPLVQLSKWSIEFVGGKSTDDQPKSCFNCHFMYAKQKTCSLLGPDIIIDYAKKDGKKYTPVCGMQDAGKPMVVSDNEVDYKPNAEIGPKKADELGLEWAEGLGTNCGGANEGAPCKYFDSPDGKDGICLVVKKGDNKVDWDDCCAAHDGPSISWREAQRILEES